MREQDRRQGSAEYTCALEPITNYHLIAVHQNSEVSQKPAYSAAPKKERKYKSSSYRAFISISCSVEVEELFGGTNPDACCAIFSGIEPDT